MGRRDSTTKAKARKNSRHRFMCSKVLGDQVEKIGRASIMRV